MFYKKTMVIGSPPLLLYVVCSASNIPLQREVVILHHSTVKPFCVHN